MLPLGLRLLLGRARRDGTSVLTPLEEAARRYSRNAAVFIQLGVARLDAGEPSGADAAWVEAQRLEPDNPAVAVFRGIACLDMGDAEAALVQFDDALKRDKGNVLAAQFKCLARICSGDWQGLQVLCQAPVLGNSHLVERLMVEIEKILIHEEDAIEDRDPPPLAPVPAVEDSAAAATSPDADETADALDAAGQLPSLPVALPEPALTEPPSTSSATVPAHVVVPEPALTESPGVSSARVPANVKDVSVPEPALTESPGISSSTVPGDVSVPEPTSTEEPGPTPAEASADSVSDPVAQAKPSEPSVDDDLTDSESDPTLPPYFSKTTRPLWESLMVSTMVSDMRARRLFSQAQKLLDRALEDTGSHIALVSRPDLDVRLDQVVAMIEEALTLDNSLSRGFFFLGQAAFFARRFTLARRALARSRKDDQDNFLNLYLLGRVVKIKGNIQEAERLLLKAVDAFEKFPEALCVLGQIAVARSDWRAARRFLRDAAHLDMTLLLDRLERARDAVCTPVEADAAPAPN